MNNEAILRNISKHIQLNEEEVSCFTSLLSSRQLARKTTVLREGEICKYISFVHSGALRAFHVDKDGKESTIMFALADWWVTDMFCFLHANPAMMYIEAIEDSSVLQLSRENFDRLFLQVPKFERFFRILMQNAYTREQLRVIENLSLSAEDRYERFLQKYPHIAEVVTQKQIASYLGITPEFLSLIRKKRSRKSIS